MIKLQNMTPQVYNNESRDFQLLARLYDVVLNSVKTNAEIINTAPLSDNSDDQLLDLLTMTLGFKQKHNYNIRQLRAVCSIFSEVLKYKGTLYAIELVCQAIVNAENATGETHIYTNNINKNFTIDIRIPAEVTDLTLLRDLLDYILPAGTTANITSVFQITKPIETVLYLASPEVYVSQKADYDTSVIVDTVIIGDPSMPATDAHDNAGYIMNSTIIDPTTFVNKENN